MMVHTSRETHAWDTLCTCRSTENPLSDFLFAITFATTLGNLHLSVVCCSSVHWLISMTSHEPLSRRTHLPPSLSMRQSSCMNSEILSTGILIKVVGLALLVRRAMTFDWKQNQIHFCFILNRFVLSGLVCPLSCVMMLQWCVLRLY